MKAARIHRFGETLRIDEVGEPSPGDGEVLVRIEFAAVNPQDIWLTRGTVAGGRQRLPFVPGTEATVEAEGRRWIVAGGPYGFLRDGFYTEGIVNGVARAGEVLAKHFPRSAERADVNELADDVSED